MIPQESGCAGRGGGAEPPGVDAPGQSTRGYEIVDVGLALVAASRPVEWIGEGAAGTGTPIGSGTGEEGDPPEGFAWVLDGSPASIARFI